MRRFELGGTWVRLCASAVCGMLLCTSVHAQDLLPAYRFDADNGDWSSDGNWVLAGSDPAVNGVPGDSDIASIQNRGLVNISSDVPNVHSLSLRSGTVQLSDGGSLTVGQQTIIGSGGVLSVAGGSLATDSLAVLGTIDLSADLASDLSFGSSWPVATAASVAGQPRAITVGGSAPTLPLGLNLSMVPTDDGASVVVESLPILQIDRVTGGATITNPAGGPIEFKGYSIKSDGEKLTRGRGAWNSLEDQGLDGWGEAGSTRLTRFSEINFLGSSTLNVGESLSIGTPYDGIGDAPDKEDIAFEFLLADGRTLSTDVVYTGAPNDLVLNIDPDTGAASISHTSTLLDPFDVASYSVVSNSGSLLPDNFSGIGEEGWGSANPQATGLADLNLTGSKMFAIGTSVDLGNIFNTAGERDLVFQFSTADHQLLTGSVLYGMADVPVPPQPSLPGDADGDGDVDFDDFVILSNGFNQPADPPGSGADFNMDGAVNFDDFVILSNNFGTSAAAAVPEPTGAFLVLIGILGMLKFRKRAPHIATVLVAASLCCSATQQSHAQAFGTRFIRLHPDGPNAGIANIQEALGIVNGSVIDVLKNEDLTGEIEVLDVGGGVGDFNFDQSPYLNGVDDETMDNFLQYFTGTLEIPEGDYTIGCGSDDGCLIRLFDVAFDDPTYNENGATVSGDGELLFNAGRGHDWTYATFSIPSGGVTTGFEAIFNEGGGGDSMEIGILDDKILAEDATDTAARRLTATSFFELTDGVFDIQVLSGTFAMATPGDFNLDGVVNADDAGILSDNFESGTTLAEGDMNLDGIVNFQDVALFSPVLAAAQAQGAASIPEPGSMSMILLGVAALAGLRRRRFA